MFRKKWEVYRVIPESWEWPEYTETVYSRHWTQKGAQEVADKNDALLRNGRSDEDFAAFKVRKIG